MYYEFPLHLSRHCFTARDAARAGDIWRLFQDVAMLGSTAAGWPPRRFREEGVAFVVREMTAVHHREAHYGEAVHGRTCISRFRRGLLATRQIEIAGDDGPIAATTQEWAHVKRSGDALRPARADASLQRSFHPEPEAPSAHLPEFAPAEGPEHAFTFRCWHTWMDPLAHANHPAYVDWCDEALSVLLGRAGVDPVELQPVAEWVKWRIGVEAPSEVTVRTRRIGLTADGSVVCEHRVEADGDESAVARTVRRLATTGNAPLTAALDQQG